MIEISNNAEATEVEETKIVLQKWTDNRMSGKFSFLLSLMYIIITYSLLMSFPSLTLSMYCLCFPILFGLRIYSYVKSKSFLYLFDNCYFVNTALIIFLWLELPMETFFVSIFAAVNGPVLWAVLPFRNTLAFHDLDKVTSCYIHWAPTIVTWAIRWFPYTSSNGWIRTFDSSDIDITPIYKWQDSADYVWLLVVPMGFLVLHDLIYALIVHVIVRPSEEYSDSFTYQRSKDNIIGVSIRNRSPKLQLIFYMTMSFTLYMIGILVSILCYRMFIIHTVLISVQLLIMIWNGGCYYLDYFAYLALRTHQNDTEKTTEQLRNF